MAGLIYKELVTNKILVIAAAAITVLLSAPLLLTGENAFADSQTFGVIGSLMIAVMFFMVGEILQGGIFMTDERKKWADYIIASPVTEKGQVYSKYCFAMVAGLALVLWCWAVNGIANAVHNFEEPSGLPLLTAVMMFSVITLMRAVEFPFYIGFGKVLGNRCRSLILMGVGLIAVIYLLFGDLSFFTEQSLMSLYNFIISPMKAAEAPLIVKLISAGVYLFPAFSLAAYYLSYKLSVKLYKKGAESFEK